jgi:hypothetical protein
MNDIQDVNACRSTIKQAAEDVLKLKAQVTDSEAIANIMLAYRHLEDASMRLGKTIQALDGGVSVYDKKTTVGASDIPSSGTPTA